MRLAVAARCAAAAFLLLATAAPMVLAEEPEIVPPASRDVTPPGMTPGPDGSGPLVREAVPPPPPPPPGWRRFFLPVTTDAGTFVTGKRAIRIDGVTAPAKSDTCTAGDGTAWPCGEVALWSLRRFLLGRAVQCWITPDGSTSEVTTACRVGSHDIGLWLVSQGWAKPSGDASDAYRQAADAARCAGRGLWRGAAADAGAAPCPAKPAF